MRNQVFKFGADYEVVSTESAKRAINDQYTFDQVDEPSACPYDEQVWWQVGIFSDGSQLYMNNMDGEMLIVTDGPESYYRTF